MKTNSIIKDKLIVTLKINECQPSKIERPLCNQIEHSLSSIIGRDIPDIIYLGGDKELLIRLIANLVTRARLEFIYIDDTTNFTYDQDF